MKITMFGAAKQVSGSMSLLETNSLKILVDCGLVQTNDTRKDIINNIRSFNFNPADIDYCIITHAHIDHCGLIPYLVKCGFKGPIICTEPTMNICEIALVDCAHIWQREIEKATKIRNSKKYKLDNFPVPYTMEEAEYAMKYFRGYSFNKEIVLNDEVSITFRNAGHILGAASIEVNVKQLDGFKTKTILFTGDISGKKDFHPFIKPVEYIEKADYVVCESTYGNKKHNKVDTVKVLNDIIENTCIHNGKTTLIATFSVQRLQEILWYLYSVYKNNPKLINIPIYVDTPMGKNVSKEVYEKATEFYNQEALDMLDTGENIFEWEQVKYIQSPKESMALANGNPKIIISSAGMMQAGRIVNHIESFLPSKNCSIILTGYCAIGTFGRKLLDAIDSNKSTVQSVMGKDLNIRANVYKIDGLSGHADKNDLVKYLSNIKGLKQIILNHGEIDAIEMLKSELQLKMDIPIIIPNKNTTINLK